MSFNSSYNVWGTYCAADMLQVSVVGHAQKVPAGLLGIKVCRKMELQGTEAGSEHQVVQCGWSLGPAGAKSKRLSHRET